MQKIKLSVLLCSFALSGQAIAAGAADEIAYINEQISILQAKLKRVELQAQIAAKDADVAKYGAQVSSSLSQGKDEVLPSVRSTEGFNGKMMATLAYPGSATMIVKTGDVIQGGWKVASIESNVVELQRGSEKRRLSFGYEAVSSNGLPSNNIPGGGMPSPPMYR